MCVLSKHTLQHKPTISTAYFCSFTWPRYYPMWLAVLKAPTNEPTCSFTLHCCSAMLGVFLLAVHVWNLHWWCTKASWFCTEAQSLILYQGTFIDFVVRHSHWFCSEACSMILYRGTFLGGVLRHIYMFRGGVLRLIHWFCTEVHSLAVYWGTLIEAVTEAPSLVVYWGVVRHIHWWCTVKHTYWWCTEAHSLTGYCWCKNEGLLQWELT